MTTKYSVDLRQFNNGESEKVTFPTFEQSVMYGLYKLKESIKSNQAIIQAIIIEDAQGRKILVSPAMGEIEKNVTMVLPMMEVKLKVDPTDGEATFVL